MTSSKAIEHLRLFCKERSVHIETQDTETKNSFRVFIIASSKEVLMSVKRELLLLGTLFKIDEFHDEGDWTGSYIVDM